MASTIQSSEGETPHDTCLDLMYILSAFTTMPSKVPETYPIVDNMADTLTQSLTNAERY